MKRISATILFVFTMLSGFSQEKFVYPYTEQENTVVRNQVDIKEHYLGVDIATKLQLLKETYTYVVKDAISYTERTITEKSSIYNSVKKADKFFKEQVKSNAVTIDEATTQLSDILVKALNVRFQETGPLEELFWDTKDPQQIVAIYQNQIILEE